MKTPDFETKLKQILSTKANLSMESELFLFTQAEELLSVRRERVASREAIAKKAIRRADRAKKRRLLAFQQGISRLSEFLAIHPDTLATATTFFALVLAFIAFHNKPGVNFKLSYSDLPDFPKNNDFPNRYDAQIIAERQAYEREVEDAHKRTSGGI